jgi:hypothetical protein
MIDNHVSILDTIPSAIFNQALEEVNSIDWKHYEKFDSRSNTSKNLYFATSKTIHLRTHNVSTIPQNELTIEVFNNTVECIDTVFISKFAAVKKLVDHIHTLVNGKRLGRIMLVKLLAGGEVPDHIDPGKYFLTHRRFHVPFITDKKVTFKGKLGSTPLHMPVGTLCQLNNRNTHSAKNDSTIDRVHLIVDIETEDVRYSFQEDDTPSCQYYPPNPDNRLQLRPIYSTLRDFTPVTTLWPKEIETRRFNGKFLIKYASLKNTESSWADSYFKDGTELNVNIRSVTMYKLKPFWDDYSRYFQAATEKKVMFARMKFKNYYNNSIDYVSVWNAATVDEFDNSFEFNQSINVNNLHVALEEFNFLFNGFKFYVNDKDVLNFIDYCKSRCDKKDNARFEYSPHPAFIDYLQKQNP